MQTTRHHRTDSADPGREGTVQRFDMANITGEITRTPEGYIRAKAIVTRVGVFNYRNADGSPRRELRLPEEVFNADSLETMKMIPVTNTHPTEWVDSSNVDRLGVGMTGETVEPVDGKFVSCTLTITRKDAIAAIDAGRRQLSLGYSLELDPTPGNMDGESYDCIQRNIKYNHLALVDKARAGDSASLRLDGYDFLNAEDPEGGKMKQIVINGVTYNVDDAVADAYAREAGRAVAAEDKAKTEAARADAAEAKADEAKAEIGRVKESQKNVDSEIETRVAARLAVIESAKKVLNADGFKAVESKTDREIRIAVISAKNPGFNADGKSDEYIVARFDGVVEMAKDGDNDGDKNTGDKQSSGFKKNSDGDDKRVDESDMSAAYARQLETLKNPNAAK